MNLRQIGFEDVNFTVLAEEAIDFCENDSETSVR